MSDGNANCQCDSDVLIINHLREALAKENADAEKWSCECQRLEKERDEARAACADLLATISEWINSGLIVDDPSNSILSMEHGKGFLSPEKRGEAIKLLSFAADVTPDNLTEKRIKEALKLLETE